MDEHAEILEGVKERKYDLPAREYACARCGCEIKSHWTHAQAREEYEREFDEEERKYDLPRYVCPLCYYRIVASRPKHHLVPEGELKV